MYLARHCLLARDTVFTGTGSKSSEKPASYVFGAEVSSTPEM
jgi:hypothetical protein